MVDKDWHALEAMHGEFQRWVPCIDSESGWIRFDLVLDPWTPSEYTEWVRAEDAFVREAKLLARIRELEDRVSAAAEIGKQMDAPLVRAVEG